jgi:hypothetical protein
MAVINIDPCDASAVVLDTWTSKTNAAYASGAGRNGGGALRINGGNVAKGVTSIAECTRHFAFSFASIPSSDQTIARVSDSGTTQLEMYLTTTGFIGFKRGTTAIGSLSTIQFAAGVKYHFQWHLIIDPTTGLSEIRLNGKTSAALTFTGNTRSTANSSFNQLQFFAPSVNYDFSDIFDVDASGSPTGYQGDLLVGKGTLTGDSATSGKNQFAPTPAQTTGNHYLNVIDNSDATYNADATTGDVERYRFSLPSSVPPAFLATRFKATLDDAGPRSCAPGFSSGGVDSVGPDFGIPSSAAWSPYYVLVNDPGTGSAWGANPTADVIVKVTA